MIHTSCSWQGLRLSGGFEAPCNENGVRCCTLNPFNNQAFSIASCPAACRSGANVHHRALQEGVRLYVPLNVETMWR